MKRLMIAGILVAVAVLVFALGGWGSGDVEARAAGRLYSVTVTVREPAARPLTVGIEVAPASADTVTVSTVMPQMGHATPEISARRQEAGRFLATGELVTMNGVWEFAVRVHGAAGEEVVTVPVLVAG
ncbi:hypothetical protein Misp01_63590 [Microtetraspora sp. NBRC 13810]|uniref:hypothetical protein n=1 Tax=Microtetraspora sp. NBRC 13810 TaxID=3030990 RepID=UPI0024A12367|nr:hypothetical protein [Microtetraspora sp. NBRC 13810]GLW11231.1 hypothetical protein Misp01_63590 [Microtetraspora sp. NBRC 13810]